jgi:hypothetical protein
MFLNQKFRAFIEKKLENETYLQDRMKHIIDMLESQFEKKIKPVFDYGEYDRDFDLKIAGLRRNTQKGFLKDRMVLTA